MLFTHIQVYICVCVGVCMYVYIYIYIYKITELYNFVMCAAAKQRLVCCIF